MRVDYEFALIIHSHDLTKRKELLTRDESGDSQVSISNVNRIPKKVTEWVAD
jgi:hypothetical protein